MVKKVLEIPGAAEMVGGRPGVQATDLSSSSSLGEDFKEEIM